MKWQNGLTKFYQIIVVIRVLKKILINAVILKKTLTVAVYCVLEIENYGLKAR